MSLLGEEEVGDAGKHSDGPAEGGHDDGPSQVGEGKDVEGSADGQVALQGEGEDGEHARVGGAGGGVRDGQGRHLSEKKLRRLQKTGPKGQGYWCQNSNSSLGSPGMVVEKEEKEAKNIN